MMPGTRQRRPQRKSPGWGWRRLGGILLRRAERGRRLCAGVNGRMLRGGFGVLTGPFFGVSLRPRLVRSFGEFRFPCLCRLAESRRFHPFGFSLRQLCLRILFNSFLDAVRASG